MNTIVFVEDDAEVGSLIAAYLAKHDMQVTVEPRGDPGRRNYSARKPDLVLLDIMLPGKDGMTICRDLRAKWSGPIVLLTSLDSDMNHILALEMGCLRLYSQNDAPCCFASAFTFAFASE